MPKTARRSWRSSHASLLMHARISTCRFRSTLTVVASSVPAVIAHAGTSTPLTVGRMSSAAYARPSTCTKPLVLSMSTCTASAMFGWKQKPKMGRVKRLATASTWDSERSTFDSAEICARVW